MLTLAKNSRRISPARQSGTVLFITLIVLVSMTLATIALMRSVDTTNIIAGNLAFKRTAQLAADAGTEQALTVTLPYLIKSGQLSNTAGCPAGFGYKSFYEPYLEPPTPGATWETYWQNLGSCPITLPPDALGNKVSYVIEALCNQNGWVGCQDTPPLFAQSCVAANLGKVNFNCPPAQGKYFRITSRVEGPRNTVSFIQVIVAM